MAEAAPNATRLRPVATRLPAAALCTRVAANLKLEWTLAFRDALGRLRPHLTATPKLLAAISVGEWAHHG